MHSSASVTGRSLGCVADAALICANLSDANLTGAALGAAQLSGAKLRGTVLTSAKLLGASFLDADLNTADLCCANLRGATLHGALLSWTVFGNTDLSEAKDLEHCEFRGPCVIDHRTIERSGPLPEDFLRGCGLADWQIEAAKLHQPGLTPKEIENIIDAVTRLRSKCPIQIANLFIAYSHADAEFIDRIEKNLKDRGVRYWRDIHDAPAGPLESIVARAMQDATVLLVLSEHSAESDWVEFEAEQARKLERESSRHVLCPIALDDKWTHSNWSGVLRNQIKKYNVLDFSNWRDSEALNDKVERLLSGVKLFYSAEPS